MDIDIFKCRYGCSVDILEASILRSGGFKEAGFGSCKKQKAGDHEAPKSEESEGKVLRVAGDDVDVFHTASAQRFADSSSRHPLPFAKQMIFHPIWLIHIGTLYVYLSQISTMPQDL